MLFLDRPCRKLPRASSHAGEDSEEGPIPETRLCRSSVATVITDAFSKN